jgi:hypothetical protein
MLASILTLAVLASEACASVTAGINTIQGSSVSTSDASDVRGTAEVVLDLLFGEDVGRHLLGKGKGKKMRAKKRGRRGKAGKGFMKAKRWAAGKGKDVQKRIGGYTPTAPPPPPPAAPQPPPPPAGPSGLSWNMQISFTDALLSRPPACCKDIVATSVLHFNHVIKFCGFGQASPLERLACC